MNGKQGFQKPKTLKYKSKGEGNREVTDVVKKTEEMYLYTYFSHCLLHFF